MRWEDIQPAGNWKRNGVVMRAYAKNGTAYEIALRFFDWGGRRNRGYTLLRNGEAISKEQSSHFSLQTLAAEDAGEPNEPRYDDTRRWSAESSTGERHSSLTRVQVHEILAGQPIAKLPSLPLAQKEALLALDTRLYLRRTLTASVNGTAWTFTELA